MATSYKTPGVYVEEIAKFPPSIAPVETAIPAFIGYTEKAQESVPGDLQSVPKRISSMVEYELYFGGADPETKITVKIQGTKDATTGLVTASSSVATLAETDRSKFILYYAMQMYFANGGGPCYIVAVNTVAEEDKPKLSDLSKGVAAIEKEDEPTLIVIPEAQGLSKAEYGSLVKATLDQCAKLQDRFVIMDLIADGKSMNDQDTNLLTAVGDFRDAAIGDNLKYGAVYGPNIETSIDFVYDAAQVQVTIDLGDGSPHTKSLADCEATDTAYHQLAETAIADLGLKLPPSSSVAGIYAAVDSTRGVWKAPANVSLGNVIAPTIKFTNIEQDQMNVDASTGKSVNAIRSFVGKGTRVWGARTLAGNDNEWRYVNVRRFFNFVEESTKKAVEQFVFEPNDANTWVKVQAMIENFLTTLWRQGALQGIKPEHAFYVAVGLNKTMTTLDILEGRMIVEIGLAAVRPAEFIILRFSHKMAES